MRSIAIITISTGAKVHSVALSTDSQITSGATASAASGRSSKNCAMHSRQATLVASPVRRSAPRRLHLLAAVDQVDRIAHRAAEHQRRRRARRRRPASVTSWPNTSSTPQ